jgi:hypothetical protein
MLVFVPLADGTPLNGVLINLSIWPTAGPESLGSPPPANFTCGAPPPGGNPGSCAYVPPALYFAAGITGPDGLADLTLGMPAGNYTVSVYDWIDGTTGGGEGTMNATETGSAEPLITTFEPVNYVTGSTDVSIGVFFNAANGSMANGYSASFYIENPSPGPLRSLGPLTGPYTVFPSSLPPGTGQYASVIFELLGPNDSVVGSTSLYASYFATPVP